MSHKNGEIKTYSSRAVFEYPPNSGQLAIVKEVARHKASLWAVIGGRVEPSDAVAGSTVALGEEPTDATFRAAATREVKEETGNKGSTDPNDGLDIIVGEQIWQYSHDTNENHITKVYAAIAVGGIIRPVIHRLGIMESSTAFLEEIDDLQEYGMLRGWQDQKSSHKYMERREELLADLASRVEAVFTPEVTASIEGSFTPDLTAAHDLGELVLQR